MVIPDINPSALINEVVVPDELFPWNNIEELSAFPVPF